MKKQAHFLPSLLRVHHWLLFMKIIPIIALLCSLNTIALNAQEADQKKSTMAPAAVKKAIQWMVNTDPEKRAAAYTTFKQYGDSEGEIYRAALENARDLHEAKLSDLLSNERLNPFEDLEELINELKTERERIFALIHTDFQKKPAEIRKLIDEVEELQKLNKKARKTASKKSDQLDKAAAIIGTALSEIDRELALAGGDGADHEILKPKEALKTILEGETYLKLQSHLESIRSETKALTEAHQANNNSKWANATQKNFANYLNEFRSLFALTPYRLEEKLSDASVGHSKDMASLGFFSHTSPVKDKKTPGDRARLAKFQYRWTGENIYMGSSSHISAYDAWFSSDGHRFIMFSKVPNLIGVGPSGRHWTMMTGKK